MIHNLVKSLNYFSLITYNTVQANENGSSCRQTSTDTAQVFTQYYPALPAAKGKGEAGTGGKQRKTSAIE